MKTDEILKILDEALAKLEELNVDRDERLMDVFESSPVIYSIFAALERINIFIQAGMKLEKEENDEGIVKEGLEIINKCMKRHSERMGYDYTFEVKPVEE